MNQTVNTKLPDARWLQIVHQQVNSLQFGEVQIVVHEGRVVQIQRTEKLRLEKSETMAPSTT